MKVNFNDHKLVSNNHGLTEIHVVWAYPPSIIIKSKIMKSKIIIECILLNHFKSNIDLSS